MECHYKTTLSDYTILTCKAFSQNEKDATHAPPPNPPHNMLKSSKISNPAEMDSISLTSWNTWEVATGSDIIALYITRRLIPLFTRPCH